MEVTCLELLSTVSLARKREAPLLVADLALNDAAPIAKCTKTRCSIAMGCSSIYLVLCFACMWNVRPSKSV